MRLPSWISKNTETNDREDGVRRLREAAWPDMFANLQSAYAELTSTQFELERRAAEIAETRDLFQQVVSSMTEAVFLTDRSGLVIVAIAATYILVRVIRQLILSKLPVSRRSMVAASVTTMTRGYFPIGWNGRSTIARRSRREMAHGP